MTSSLADRKEADKTDKRKDKDSGKNSGAIQAMLNRYTLLS